MHQHHRDERDRRRRLHPGQQRRPGDRDGHRGGGAGHPDRQRPGQTDDPTPTWTFSTPANVNPPGNIAERTYQCSVDQGTASWSACSGPGNSHTPTSDLADGNYTFRVRGSVGANTDPTPATRDFTVSTADMELVSKSDSQDPAFAGENLTYTITARNNGAGTAENARVVDVLPAGTTYQSSSIPCTDSVGTLTCGLGNLADDESKTFTITVSIARDLVHNNGAPKTITNQATADSDRNDRDSSNDPKSETTLVKAKADLAIVSFGADQPADRDDRRSAHERDPAQGDHQQRPFGADGRKGRAHRLGDLERDREPDVDLAPRGRARLPGAAHRRRAVPDQVHGWRPGDIHVHEPISPNRVDDTDPNTANNSKMTSFTVECIVPVAINIHPGSFNNPINLKSNGVIPVAVLTTRPASTACRWHSTRPRSSR